jgi:hypothetical protein
MCECAKASFFEPPITKCRARVSAHEKAKAPMPSLSAPAIYPPPGHNTDFPAEDVYKRIQQVLPSTDIESNEILRYVKTKAASLEAIPAAASYYSGTQMLTADQALTRNIIIRILEEKSLADGRFYVYSFLIKNTDRLRFDYSTPRLMDTA